MRNGDRLFTYACSGSNNQTFKFDAREHLVIGNSQSCLDIQNGYNVEGRNIISYTCHTPTDTNKNQTWTWQNNKFVSQKEGTQRCMTVGNDGYVTLSTCTDNNVAQEFEIYRP
ncbi:RICIN domain-containing protein [Citrobacter braakii]|nr:RICIN domain-containing protein [Citrobacter braakii]WFW85086.1 RICIN domain-containing protein [Citrobacter braakii]